MRTATVKVLHASEAAYLLHHTLGPDVSWLYWLVDKRRDLGADFGCRPLVPVCRLKDRNGYWRPAYRVSDLAAFIDEFKRKNPALVSPPLSVIPVELDPTDLRSWHFKRLAPSIKPPKTALHHSIRTSTTPTTTTMHFKAACAAQRHTVYA